MLRNDYPAAHPGMKIAIDPQDLGLFERKRNASRMRLRSIERRIFLAGAPDVVQQTVAVEKFYRSAHRHDDDAWRERALLLIHFRGRQIPVAFYLRRNILQ